MTVSAQQMGQLGRRFGNAQLRGHFGRIPFAFAVGIPGVVNCIDVDGREATLKADGAPCVAVDGVATSIAVTDTACVDTDGETGLST